jgi:DNA-binding beta-propeller fold protein YncE
MNRKSLTALTFWLFLLLVLLNGCDPEGGIAPPQKPASSGLFVLNQGNYMFSNASLSYYDPETREVENKVFYRTNQFELGDVAQSMTIYDSLAFIVMNNSARVDVMNVNTFRYVNTIDGLVSPRHVLLISAEKGYISDLYAKSIFIFNPQTYEVTGTISLDNGSEEFYQHPTEQLLRFGDYVFTNCWSFDNKILLIDTRTDALVDSIETGVQPVAMVIDYRQKLWVLTDGGYRGNPFGHEVPRLIRYDALRLEEEFSVSFGLDDKPTALALNGSGDTLYLVNHHVWQMPVVATTFPPQPFIDKGSRQFYALAVDAYSSEVYVSDAVDYLQAGSIYRYNAQGQPVDTFKTGIVPGFFCFDRR